MSISCNLLFTLRVTTEYWISKIWIVSLRLHFHPSVDDRCIAYDNGTAQSFGFVAPSGLIFGKSLFILELDGVGIIWALRPKTRHYQLTAKCT